MPVWRGQRPGCYSGSRKNPRYNHHSQTSSLCEEDHTVWGIVMSFLFICWAIWDIVLLLRDISNHHTQQPWLSGTHKVQPSPPRYSMTLTLENHLWFILGNWKKKENQIQGILDPPFDTTWNRVYLNTIHGRLKWWVYTAEFSHGCS